jgi:hypothetical protein
MKTFIIKGARALFISAPLLFAGLLTPLAHGDDASAGVVLPGLHSYPTGSVKGSTASLVLKGDHISLTLAVATEGSQGGSVVIDMPRFGWLGEAEPYPDRQFPELQFLVNGVAKKPNEDFKAFAGNADITAELKKAGYDPFVIADTPPFVRSPKSETQVLANLESMGAVEKYGEDYIAKWTAQREVRLDLKSDSTKLVISYKARPSYALSRFSEISGSTNLTKYCISDHELKKMLGYPTANKTFTISSYSIPVSIDQKPSLLSVEVEISTKGEGQSDLILFCGSDGRAVRSTASSKGFARTDPKGTVRILSLKRTGKF